MKRILSLYTLAMLMLTGTAMAQQGLENIIVEKYYISDSSDAAVNATGGILPVGSVTYRVYVDMLPNYIFQSAYGDPNHECRFETTTLFFNNEDRGAIHPTFNFNYCKDNTVMLDSWLSVGAACNGHIGVLKADDDGVGTVSNVDNVLQNQDPAMGIPLTQEDGMVAGTPEPVVTVGIGTEIMVFDAQNDGTNGPVFSTNNGAWASLNGSMGADSALNRVLIAQITTDGDFNFKLNIQIRNQTTFGVENYVADNAMGNEVVFPGLIYSSLNSGIHEDNAVNNSFGIFPVPAHDQVTLAYSTTNNAKTAVYSVYDLLGNKIAEQDLGTIQGTGKSTLDVSGFAPGIYMVSLNINGQILTRKLIKY